MSPKKRKNIDPMEKAMEAALSPGSFISYNAAWSFVDDVQDVADNIGKIIKNEPERCEKKSKNFLPCKKGGSTVLDRALGTRTICVEDNSYNLSRWAIIVS